MFCFAGRYGRQQPPATGRWINGHLRSQWAVFIGLFLPLGVLLNSVSLLAPIANLVAIPLVTTAVVPALLLAAVIRDLIPSLRKLLLWLAARGLRGLDVCLQLLLNMAGTRLQPRLSA